MTATNTVVVTEQQPLTAVVRTTVSGMRYHFTGGNDVINSLVKPQWPTTVTFVTLNKSLVSLTHQELWLG